MRALNDYPLVLPYQAAVPWPLVFAGAQADWVATVDRVEDWLDRTVGPHSVRWVWSRWALHQTDLCAVSFARDPDRLLFLLRWG